MNNQNVSYINQSDVTANINMPDNTHGGRSSAGKPYTIFLYVLCGLSLFFSIAAICKALPREAGFDYLGIIIGILALLVTVLMAWNIYTVIDTKKIRNDAFEYINKEVDRRGRELVISVLCYADTLNVDDYLMRKYPEAATDFLFKAIEDCMGKLYSESAIKSAVTKLYIVCC